MLREDGNTEPAHETVLQDDHQEDPYSPQIDSEGSAAMQLLQKSDTQYNKGFKIPTIVNGKIGVCEVRNRARLEEKATRISRKNGYGTEFWTFPSL